MADELDPQLEASLRAALHHEADALPLLIRSDNIERARRRRGGRRLALPASLLGLAAVLAIVVIVGGAWRANQGTAATSPSPSAAADRPLVSYDLLLGMLGVAAPDLQGQQPLDGPAGDPVPVDLGVLDAPGTVRYAIHCLGDSVTITFDDGGADPKLAQVDCAIQPMTMQFPGSERPYHVSVTASPAVRWRIVIAAVDVPSPSPTPFALATYEELERSLAESSIMPVILRGEHPVAEAGTEPVRTSLGKVGDVAYEDFAYSCTGGSIKIDKVVGGEVQTGIGTECGDNVKLFTDGTGLVDPAAEIVVTASPQVVWRIMVSGIPIPDATPTQPVVTASPSLPPAAPGETSLVTVDLTAADGQVTRTVRRPAGADEYRLYADCSGSGFVDLSVDGVEGTWDCSAIVGLQVFAPNLETDSAELVAKVTDDARFLLRLDALDRAALPGVTFLPPVLKLRGPDYFTGFLASVEAFSGCGLAWTPKAGGGFSDDCGPSWQPVPNKLVQKPGTSLSISLPVGWTVTKVDGAMARNNAILPTGRAPDERPWVATLSDGTWTFEAPPLGSWGLRLLVTATKDGDTFQVPYYAQIYVMQ